MGLPDEKRKYPRIEIQLGILFKQGIEWQPGTVQDLSEKGMAFETSMALTPGDWCHIYFSESDEVRATELNAKVVRSRVIEDSSPTKYRVAVELTEDNDQYLQDVQSLLDDN